METPLLAACTPCAQLSALITQDGDAVVRGGDGRQPARGERATQEGDQGDHRCGKLKKFY